jgi:glycerol-3-phosphate dehydrogenase
LNTYDLIVIGAGIQGAGVAYAASALGFSTLLLDKAPGPGLATSNNSSKLIHGGLRYLETGQFALVRSCLVERDLLLKAAPDLIKLTPFYIPVYNHSRRSSLKVAAGLGLYSALSLGTQGSGFQSVPENRWSSLGINQENLKAVWQYWDAQTDDHQLCLRVVKAAQHFGAQCLWQTQAIAITPMVTGYRVQLSNGQTYQCKALVNAAGPWVNQVASLNNSLPQIALRWVQGSHLLLDLEAPPGCVYLEAPQDQRPVFVLPWGGKTLVGTTELAVKSPERPSATAEETAYLLEAYNHCCPSRPATAAAIVRTFCGLRVLPGAEAGATTGNAKSLNRAPRDTYLLSHTQAPGYLAIYGGKLTAFRATAVKVLQQLEPHLPRSPKYNTPALLQPRF